MLKSASDLGLQFEYPYLNDRKKLKFAITGLKLARYLVTVLGSNIKTVTWMGDNVNYNTVFQGGSRGYLSEDINEAAGDYDSMNSAVTIIEKLGPLDANAPYVIEFRKEPANKDWANFMISCQGIGDDVSISDLEGYANVVPGTVADQSDNNLYTNTTSMTPAYDDRTFTPIVPASNMPPPAAITSGFTSDYALANANSRVAISEMNEYTSYAKYQFKCDRLPIGYYLITAFCDGLSSTNTTIATQINDADSDAFGGYKTLALKTSDFDENGHHYRTFVALAFHVTEVRSGLAELFRLEYTASSNVGLLGACATVVPITQDYYDGLTT